NEETDESIPPSLPTMPEHGHLSNVNQPAPTFDYDQTDEEQKPRLLSPARTFDDDPTDDTDISSVLKAKPTFDNPALSTLPPKDRNSPGRSLLPMVVAMVLLMGLMVLVVAVVGLAAMVVLGAIIAMIFLA
ncbi:MAG: hypothetical protein HN348_14460, partial [Proteobacteria bacterium]|nr:hypothetical protein [Pseudomonadota bacterium]